MVTTMLIFVFVLPVFEKAFKVGFQDPTNYVQELREAVMKCSKESVTHYNYLAVIQSSGYGKTRSILEFAKNCHHVYICFHKKDSSGYPKGTPKNEEMLEDLKKGKMVEECHVIAKKWIHSIITTFEHMTTSKDKVLLRMLCLLQHHYNKSNTFTPTFRMRKVSGNLSFKVQRSIKTSMQLVI